MINEKVVKKRNELMEQVPNFLKELDSFLLENSKAITIFWKPELEEKWVFLNGDLILVVPNNRKKIDDLIVKKIQRVKDIKDYPSLSMILRESVYHNQYEKYLKAVEEEEATNVKIIDIQNDIYHKKEKIKKIKEEISYLEENIEKLLKFSGDRPNHNFYLRED